MEPFLSSLILLDYRYDGCLLGLQPSKIKRPIEKGEHAAVDDHSAAPKDGLRQ